MRKPLINIDLCKKRREALRSDFNDGALILASAPLMALFQHSYRQESYFFSLTGFDEPESILIFRPGKTPESVLFVRPKDMARETWDGYRFGPEAAVSELAMDEAYPINEFSEVATKLLSEVNLIYYTLGRNPSADLLVQSALNKVKQQEDRRGSGLQTIIDPENWLSEKRLKKMTIVFQ